MDIIENGPVRVGLRVRNKLLGEHTTFVREVFLTNGVPWVEFKTHLEWNAEKKLVKAVFPLAVKGNQSTWDIPYGAVTRPNDGSERPALKWVDVSDGVRGISLMNRNRNGYDAKGSTVRLSLLRSPTWPAHNDDGGNHTVPYALYPHGGSWRKGAVHRRAHEYNVPLIALPVASHGGALPPQASLFSVEPANVMITAVKAAESGRGLVLRLVETDGRAVDASLMSHWFLRNAAATNLLEEGGKDLPSGGERIKLTFRAHEIKTVVLENWGYAPLR
jgi:alpha-mannosidase